MGYRAYIECNCYSDKQKICEHTGKKIANEFLSNTIGMFDFIDVINLLNNENPYPLLLQFLPTSLKSIVPIKNTQGLLDELELLGNEEKKYERTMLLEVITNELIASTTDENIKVFAFSKNNKDIYALNRHGFFIYEEIDKTDKYKIQFSSTEFSQNKISNEEYEFIDQKAKTKFRAALKLYPFDEEASENYYFKITRKFVKVQNEYDYLINILRKLAHLSIQTGNPITFLWGKENYGH